MNPSERRARAEEGFKKAKPIPLHRVLFNNAEFYNQGALAALDRLKLTGNAGLAAPVILCQSFAIELLLKFFVIAPHPHIMKHSELEPLGINLRGHAYSRLFDCIDEQYRAAIAETFSGRAGRPTTSDGFRDLLIELGDEPFVSWRYVYELEGNQHLDFELFGQVTDALGISADREVQRIRAVHSPDTR